jgi:hypothetical protein
MDKKEGKIKKRIVGTSAAFFSLGMFVFVLFIVLGFFVCRNHNNNISKKIAAYIPFPAVVVDYHRFITLKNINEDLRSVRSFYENQDFSASGLRVDFSTTDGQKRLKIKEKDILNKLISDKIIELLAREKGVVVSKESVDQNVARKIKEFGGEDKIKENLNNLYGWSVDDFKEKIVRPSLYRDEMEKIVQSEYEQSQNNEQREKMQKAQERLSKNEDFSSVAKDFSQGETANKGGELGWFSSDQILDELAEASFSLKEGERTDIIESELGYHIVKLEEKKIENEIDLIRVSQIFRPKFTLDLWLEKEMEKHNILILIDDYFWNKTSKMAEFSDSSLGEFELEQNAILMQ